MKKPFRTLICIMLAYVMCLAFVSCNGRKEPADLWANATYTEDTELGNGSAKLEVTVEAEGKSVVFTIHTDKKTVGEALFENDLISGENKAYGMYVNTVNGMFADYDENRCYWSFNRNDEYMLTGVDQTEFSDGDRFSLVYTTE